MAAKEFIKNGKRADSQPKEKTKKGRFDDYWKSMGTNRWYIDHKALMK